MVGVVVVGVVVVGVVVVWVVVVGVVVVLVVVVWVFVTGWHCDTESDVTWLTSETSTCRRLPLTVPGRPATAPARPWLDVRT